MLMNGSAVIRKYRGAMTAGFAMLALGGLAYAKARQSGSEGLASCRANLKQVSLGVLMYVQDYDEKFPVMTQPAQLQNRVMPYVKARNLFACPVTKADYQGNPALNYQPMAAVKSPAEMVLLRDVKPHTADSGRSIWNVAYTDGHVKGVATEPKLGNPALMPKPIPRGEQIRQQLTALRGARIRMIRQLDMQIKALEREQQRLSQKK